MRYHIRPEAWLPHGIETLEPTAHTVVQSMNNCLVIAGPGAGKTELLAQRASFLLETGLCPEPRRILAISFKRDAAKNLGDRVRARVDSLAHRFDSLTLDAFGKRLVDQFLPALPPAWRPSYGYHVITKSLSPDEARQWLVAAPPSEAVPVNAMYGWRNDEVRAFFDRVMHGYPLPYEDVDLPIMQVWGHRWWESQLRPRHTRTSQLTFPMLNRLAAYLLRCNPLIRSALCQTYSHVFLDEFQDTTASHWDLVHAAFCESQTILTAVGDSKQRIMVWAGAKTDVFETFQREFSADQKSLSSNYRSVPELVAILQRVADMVERGTVEPRASSPTIQKSDACAIYEFADSESEAIVLADMIAHAINTQQAQPRDFCILTRQQTSEMIVILQEELAKRGITLRDESTLQDLLAEPVMGIIVSTLQLATHKRNAQAWTSLLADISYLSELDPEDHGDIIEQLAIEHKQCAASWLREGRPIRDLPLALVNILGMQRYQSTYRQYANVAYLLTRLEEIGNRLQHSFEMNGDIQSLPDMWLGTNVVPAMTIHKSKGLEFKTVIFLGLEDRAWWGFSNQPEEEKRAFFVAFSRAIQRVIFTYAARRKTRPQSRQKIDELYNILQMAGVGVVSGGPPLS